MMVRSELDTVRTQLADAAHLPHEEVADVAWQLLVELERTRMREALASAAHIELVATARACLAGRKGCFLFLQRELAARGHRIPEPSDAPTCVLAEAIAARGDVARP